MERGLQVSVLLDADATKQRMVHEIESLILATDPGETSVITYSGHGSFIPDADGDEPDDARDEILCPFDIEDGASISDDELYGLFRRRMSGANIAFVSDSCHSGSIGRLIEPPVESGPPQRIRFLPPTVFLDRDQLPKRRGVVRQPSAVQTRSPEALILSGCEDWQVSGDGYFQDRANGVMTFYALRALRGLPQDATYRHWFTEIRKVLPNQRDPQAPKMESPEGLMDQPVFRPSAG